MYVHISLSIYIYIYIYVYIICYSISTLFYCLLYSSCALGDSGLLEGPARLLGLGAVLRNNAYSILNNWCMCINTSCGQ